jgi:adenosylcobyric acid synthase
MNRLEVCLVKVPGQANTVDSDALSSEPDVRLRQVDSPGELERADLVLLIGSGDYQSDLTFMRQRDLHTAMVAFSRMKGATVGLGHGCALLGVHLSLWDQPNQGADGLGLLSFTTQLNGKTQRQSVCAEGLSGLIAIWCQAIQFPAVDTVTGTSLPLAGARPAFRVIERAGAAVEETNGVMQYGGWTFGTSMEGLLQHSLVRRRLLNALRVRRGMPSLEP